MADGSARNRAGRDPYPEVGAALRELTSRAASTPLRAREYRVLLAVVGVTASWSRLRDTVSVGQLEDATAMDRRSIRRALAELSARGLIRYTPGDSPKGERRTVSTVALPTPNDRGSTEPPVTGGPPAPGTNGDRGSSGHRPGVHETRDRGSTRPPFREVPEKSSEDARASAPATTTDDEHQDNHQPQVLDAIDAIAHVRHDLADLIRHDTDGHIAAAVRPHVDRLTPTELGDLAASIPLDGAHSPTRYLATALHNRATDLAQGRPDLRTKRLDSARSFGRSLATLLDRDDASERIAHDYGDDPEAADAALAAFDASAEVTA